AFRDRLDALEAAARAFELAPGAQEALFNKALALEALHLPRQAAKTWRCYLEKDRQSGWAREAQARLDRLEHRLGRIRRAAAGAEPTALEAKLAALRREPLSPQAEIRALIDEANAAGQPAMVAAATRTLAHRTSLDGRLAASADLYADATRRFETLGDANQAADARVMRAEILGALARLNEALAELADVLAVAEDLRDPLRRHAAYWVAGNVVASVAPAAANALWSEAAEACRDMPDRPWCAVDARIRLAREAPSPSWAKKELAAAARDLELIPASREKNRTELDLAMVQAKWLQREPSARNLDAADRLYKQVIEGFDAMASPVSVAKARAGRVDVLTRLGMAPAARAELEASLLSLRLWDDTQRFRPEASEAGTPGALRDVFERLISLYLAESGNDLSVRALLLAEEMRDRLAPRLAHRFEAMTEADLAQFVEELAPESAVVEIVVLDSAESGKRLAVAWIFAAGSLKQVSLPLPAKLEAILDEVRQSAEAANLRSWRRTTAELWGGLVGPVLAEVPAGTRRLAIVPDAELYGVPFRGLWNPEARRYLDEDFEVVLAPSLRSLTPALPVQNRDLMQGPVLAAAFESFSALGLGNLASAMAEKEAVASVYGETAMSPCAATDWSTLRRCLPEAAMVHLATHAAADSQRPGWSWLALPQETVSLERLWSELPPLPLRPLVVLSACESVATAKGGEGLGGLARPFLARGARAVVGTLWR
ncbi:MAG: CHAT domain-containing protein, partial [Acidobacteriota bacterium]